MEQPLDSQKLDQFLRPYPLETRRPIVSLAFIAPMLLLYELGILLLGNQAIRNGLDEMFRAQMYRMGLGEMIILPIITVAILLSWHHLQKDRWSFRPRILAGMVVESIFLGLILLWAAKAQQVLFDDSTVSVLSVGLNQFYSVQWWSNTVAFLGAGIYEELVFRLLMLLCLLYTSPSPRDRTRSRMPSSA